MFTLARLPASPGAQIKHPSSGQNRGDLILNVRNWPAQTKVKISEKVQVPIRPAVLD